MQVSYQPFEQIIDYDTFKHWTTSYIKNGKRFHGPVEWKPIAERNIRESCKKYWRKHVEEGGSIWTIFTEDGWQKSPSECIKFKKNVQNKVRRMFREAEKYMFIHIVDEPVGSEGSVSTIPTEEEYWKH
jgi:hypothetical protein